MSSPQFTLSHDHVLLFHSIFRICIHMDAQKEAWNSVHPIVSCGRCDFYSQYCFLFSFIGIIILIKNNGINFFPEP